MSASKQYLLFWYIAETLPPDDETALNEAMSAAPDPTVDESESERRRAGSSLWYKSPPGYPEDLRLSDRVKQEPAGYEPTRHSGTGVDDEEAWYDSHLLPVMEAMDKLKGSLQADVKRL
ncbi:MAG: hypothetical protein M1817_004837 [Caeruleum heppii]|nr:MAG: hypothetical protein M1817_004837 [Caeruleum heppii]